jgi:hypothetical protein
MKHIQTCQFADSLAPPIQMPVLAREFVLLYLITLETSQQPSASDPNNHYLIFNSESE